MSPAGHSAGAAAARAILDARQQEEAEALARRHGEELAPVQAALYQVLLRQRLETKAMAERFAAERAALASPGSA